MKKALSMANLAKGMTATMIGAILIILTYGIIFKLLMFSFGLLLLHRGIQMLNPEALDQFMKAGKRAFRAIMIK